GGYHRPHSSRERKTTSAKMHGTSLIGTALGGRRVVTTARGPAPPGVARSAVGVVAHPHVSLRQRTVLRQMGGDLDHLLRRQQVLRGDVLLRRRALGQEGDEPGRGWPVGQRLPRRGMIRGHPVAENQVV